MRILYSSVFAFITASGILAAAYALRLEVQELTTTAQDPQRPLLIYFKSAMCTACPEIDRLFEKPEIIHKLEERYVPVSMNLDESPGIACAQIYGIHFSPSLIIADHDGTLLFYSDGTLSAETLLSLVNEEPRMIAASADITSQHIQSAHNQHQHTYHTSNNLEAPAPAMLTTLTLPVQTAEARPVFEGPAPVPFFPEKPAVLSTESVEATFETPVTEADKIDIPTEEIETDINIQDVTTEQTQEKTTEKEISPVTDLSVNLNEDDDSVVNDITSLPYSIQLGFFNTKTSAGERIEEAVLKGLIALRLEPVLKDGRTYYRVLSGGYATAREARAALAHAQSLGFQAAIRY